MRQSEEAVSRLQAVLKERLARSAEESERVATWLRSEQAKEFLRRSPELKEAFSGAAAAARTAPKEQAAAVASEVKALDKVQAQWQLFASSNAIVTDSSLISFFCGTARFRHKTLHSDRSRLPGHLLARPFAVALCEGLEESFICTIAQLSLTTVEDALQSTEPVDAIHVQG